MCFTEFVGYTCGHTSAEVLRPCPMTTNLHNNPVCSSHGRRPILAQEMCPACQRILHGRAVLILEWEHHWMHERGVCGCPVIFPDLIRPRVVGRGRTFEAAEQVRNETNKEKKISRGGNGKTKRVGKGTATTGLKNHANAFLKTHPTTLTDNRPPSLPKRPATGNGATLKKASVKGNPGMKTDNKPAEIGVRIASFYGVEWVDEHRQLHKAGSCKCTGDFSFYQTPEAYRNASSLYGYGGEQAVHTFDFYSAGGQIFESSTSSSAHFQPQEQAFPHSPGFTPHSSDTYNNFSTPGLQNVMEPETRGQKYPSQHSQAQQCQHKSWHQETQTGNPYQAYHQSWVQAGQQQQPGDIYQDLQHVQPAAFLSNVGLPVRSPGAIYQVDPARSTNPLYNYACNEGAKIGPYADGQTVDYPKAKDAPHPLVGLPIGAGPEGPDLFSHVGRFDCCVLLRQGALASVGKSSAVPGNLEKSSAGARAQAGVHPVSRSTGGAGNDNKTRLLCSKSASVACLHELKVERNMGGSGPGWHSGNAASMATSEASTH